MRRYSDPEENSERWMVSYADFITLLFAFFVVMYAISSVNDDKYAVLSETLRQAFSVDVTSPDPIQVGEPTLAASPHVVDIPDSHAYADVTDGDTYIEDPVETAKSLLGGFAHQQGVSVTTDNDWLELTINAEVLFSSGQAQLNPQTTVLLDEALAILLSSSNPVTIEGYTDNIANESVRYPSNWELSAARASSVARYFVDQGIRQERMAAVGYGENHPIFTNATPDGRAANRRVVIVVARRSDSSRNLNAKYSATAVVRAPAQAEPPASIRTEGGGLLFSAEQQTK